MNKLIIIGGHTASGKTGLSIEVASALSTEIVSADSMLVYKHMDIGTAKPSITERAGIKHHMIDVIEPWEHFTVSAYYDMAIPSLSEIAKDRVPVVAGGTGFYINTIINGMYSCPAAPAEIKERLEQRLLNGETLSGLHKELSSIDPVSAKRIHPNDMYRILRALEVYYSTGKTMSHFREAHAQSSAGIIKPNILFIVLRLEKERLKNSVIARTQKMLDSGLMEETQKLLDAGCTENTKSMRSIGYRQAVMHVQSGLSIEDAKISIIEETMALAKRQNTWFKGRPNTRFYNPLTDKHKIFDDIKNFVGL
jgi:tRNA dimethylallyltransferase